VGNEILSDYSIANSTWSCLVPAMENIHLNLRKRSISRVKIGTTLAMDAHADSDFPRPPSATAFHPDIASSVVRCHQRIARIPLLRRGRWRRRGSHS
jgi:hypothetical protein